MATQALHPGQRWNFHHLRGRYQRGGVVVQQGPRLDRVSLVGCFDLEEIAVDLETFFD